MSHVADTLAAAGLEPLIVRPSTALYEERVASYWSRAQQLRPALIVRPTSAEDVAKVLKALVPIEGCNFAVRSGGHILWEGGSNIKDGVTIDLGALDKVAYNPKTELAELQPGAQWVEAYKELEKHQKLVPGGRDAHVGVGGFSLGGGLSWHGAKLGFSCDHIVNYEVVLADGRIIQANASENADLFLVLKGGACNFGIVTRFDYATFDQPADGLWAGVRIVSAAETPKVIDALVSFNATLTDHRDEACISAWMYQPALGGRIVTNFLANVEGKPNAPSLAKYQAIPALLDTTGNKSMVKVALETQQPAGYFVTWINLVVKNDAATIAKAAALHEEAIEDLKAQLGESEFDFLCIFQPFSPVFAEHSRARGGNVMGLDRMTDDALVFFCGVHVKDEAHFAFGDARARALVGDLEAFAAGNGTLVNQLYVNYCDGQQDPFSKLSEADAAKIIAAARKYDPTGVFQTRCPGGFKISKSKAWERA